MQVADIDRELDLARTQGPVRDIIIPPCPELLAALQVEVGQGDPDPVKISVIAGSDVAMAAALLRTANSPLYSRSRPASTVAEAVSMLGVEPTVTLLTSFLTRRAIRIQSSLIEHFWETSTRRAIAMGFIARQLYGVDPEIAHTCGLFCHVGIPVMLQGLKGYSGTLAEALARQDRSFTETENAAHRTDHAVVGAIVAKTWRLPPVIAIAVRLHHDFTVLHDERISTEVRTLIAIALVADHLVAKYEEVEEQKEWVQHGPECLGYLNITEPEADSWLDILHPQFENVTATNA
jgi:HD-like signal output (HDOD) protein